MAYGLPPLWNWATNLNYGAGSYPWSAGPTKVAPSAPLIGFTPGTGASAPEMNYNLNALANQDALLLQFGGLNPAKNWQLPFTIDANESVDMAWNPDETNWGYGSTDDPKWGP